MRALLTLVFCAIPLTAFADSIEYVTANNGQFGTVDDNTGIFTLIGTTTANPLSGIANIGGTLYAVNSLNQLVTINASNGAATTIGSTGISFITVAGSGNQLFGMDAANQLYSINLTTGAALAIGSTGITPLCSNCGYANSLAGNGNVLYYTEELGGNGSVMASSLYRIDEATGQSTFVGLTGIHDIVGAGFTNNTLWGYTSPFLSASTVPSVYSIDTTTGAATLSAKLGANLTGAVFGATSVPEPTSWLALLCAGMLLSAIRIREILFARK